MHVPEAWDQNLLVRWPGGREQPITVAWVVEMQAQHVTGHVDDIRRARQAHGVRDLAEQDGTKIVIEIETSQVTPALRSLFDPTMPTAIRCFAVLGGGNAGRILTDKPDSPCWAYVWEADDGTLYRGGAQDAGVLLDVVTTLRQEGLVALAFRDADPAISLFPPSPNAGATCLELDRPLGSNDLSPYLGRLPMGYEIYRMDRALLESSPHREGTISRYGSIESFLETGVAVSLMHGGDTVCEAYADMDVTGMREIGVTTHKAYRNQGFATITCAHLIAICEQAGSVTCWDCARLNRASVALARKLGFRNDRQYRLLAWFPTEG